MYSTYIHFIYRSFKSVRKYQGKKKRCKFKFSLFGSTYAESKFKAVSFLSFLIFFFFSTNRLTDLSLEKTAITDKSLLAMVEHGVTAIEYLDLRYCHGITDYGLMLLRPLRSMKRLWILGCRSITERGLASFRERMEIDLSPRPICAIRPPSLQV